MTDKDSHPIESDTVREESQQTPVLVAGDDEDFRETPYLWLVDEVTYETNEVANGENGLEELAETVDMLVRDRQLPNLSVPEVVEHLDKTSFEGTPIVISANKPESPPTTQKELQEEIDDLLCQAYKNEVALSDRGYPLRHSETDIPSWEVTVTRVADR